MISNAFHISRVVIYHESFFFGNSGEETFVDLCGKHEATMKNLKNVKCW